MRNRKNFTYQLLVPAAVGVALLAAGCGKGATGSVGPTGITGLTGAQGATGADGNNGTNGNNGANGANGATGSTGTTGSVGTTTGGFAYVATTAGIEVFTVEPTGNVVQTKVRALPGDIPALGLAVTPNQEFLVVTSSAGLYVYALDPASGDPDLLNSTAVAALNGTPQGSIAIDATSSAGVFGDSDNLIEGFTINPSGNITVGNATTSENYPDSTPGTPSSVAITSVGGNDIVTVNSGTDIVAFTLTSAGNLTDNSGNDTVSGSVNFSANFSSPAPDGAVNVVTALGTNVLAGTDDGADLFTVDSFNALTGGNNTDAFIFISDALLINVPGFSSAQELITSTSSENALFVGNFESNNQSAFNNPDVTAAGAPTSVAVITSNTGTSIAVTTNLGSNTITGFLLQSPFFPTGAVTATTSGDIDTVTPNNIAVINVF